jgi:hypothetical protein
METMTHHLRAEIATEKQSPFRPHQCLAAPNLFLDTMLSEEHGRHVRLTIWEPSVTYTGMDPDMSPEV